MLSPSCPAAGWFPWFLNGTESVFQFLDLKMALCISFFSWHLAATWPPWQDVLPPV